MNEEGLGRRLQQARQAAGMTQQVLCQKANLSYSTLAKIERGAIKAPSIFTIQSIAETLGTTLDDLLGIESKNRTPKIHSKSGVSFVFFDVNGCLVHFFHQAFTKLAELSGEPTDIIETEYWHYNDLVCRGEMKLEEFNRFLAKRIKVPSINWRDYYFAAVKPIPGTAELLGWVSGNYKIGLLTNSMPGFLDELIRLGYVPNIKYDVIVDSSNVGAIKPEAKIYKVAQEKANCLPSEILLVDDSRTNLMAAEKLGWHVSWFNDYNSSESIDNVRRSLKPEE